MKSICFVGTQMQLINCVEYLDSVKSTDNTLIITTNDKTREKQVYDLLKYNCFGCYFTKIKSLSMGSNRIINFLLSFVHSIYLLIYSKCTSFDNLIMGNYRMYYSRLFESIQRSAHNSIIVDDGLATLTIFRDRQKELEGNYLSCFVPNRFLQILLSRYNRNLIPHKVTFFSIFKDNVGNDQFAYNSYKYLKYNSHSIDIPNSLLNADVVFLGQPLYTKGDCMDSEHYAKYLEVFASKNNGLSMVYYAHPEESIKNWDSLGVCAFEFIENKFSFELVASLLKRDCRVVSFYTSGLTNILSLNPAIKPESIYINEQDITNKSLYSNILICYQHFADNNILIHHYHEID